jgi:Flp pilus assembly CpaF family ATPase
MADIGVLARPSRRLTLPTDPHLVGDLARVVADQLVEDRLLRSGGRGHPLSPSEERELAQHLVSRQLDLLARRHLDAGDEPLDAAAEAALAEAVLAAVLGLGRIQPLLDDPEISDIHIRGCDSVWLKLRDGSRVEAAPVATSDEELVELVRVAAARMGRDERRFDAAHPELNLQLPDGSRLFAVMAVSARPAVVIRRHRFELSDLGQLRRRGMIDRALHEFLAAAVRARRNVIVAGGTGSGKTTLLRALLNEVPARERIVTIEDAYELGLDRFSDTHPDHDMLQARPANTEGRGLVSMADLTRMALRMDPDRVVVGEVRGAEAFPMLLAMSQGNNGSMCTMHADSTRSVFPKLAAYVSMADTGLPVETVNLLVANAVHFVVHIDVVDGVRRVASVREVVDADGSRIVSNEVFRPGVDGRAVPGYPMRDVTLAALEAAGLDRALLEKPDGWWQ